MASPRDDRCGSRFRRGRAEPEAPAEVCEEVGLTPLGQAFIDALRDDERFRDVIADPFGEHGPARA